VLKAEGARTAAILRAEGESKAIETVFRSIHANVPDEKLLAYQYLQMLPQLAQGSANKVFVIPSEFSQAFAKLGDALGGPAAAAAAGSANGPGPEAPRFLPRTDDSIGEKAAADAQEAAQAAADAAREASLASSPVSESLPPGLGLENGTPDREE